MAKEKISMKNVEIGKYITRLAIATYVLDFLATVIGQFLRGDTNIQYQVVSWLGILLVPLIAFLIGSTISNWKKQSNKTQVSIMFAVGVYLWFQIIYTLLPYAPLGSWHFVGNWQYIVPALLAFIIQISLYSINVKSDSDRFQLFRVPVYISILTVLLLLSFIPPLIKLIPVAVDLSSYNPFHSSTFSLVVWALLVGPASFLLLTMVVNTIVLKNFFLGSVIAVFGLILFTALLVSVGGVGGLHDTKSFSLLIVASVLSLGVDIASSIRIRSLLSQ
jgi:hypothetical protein